MEAKTTTTVEYPIEEFKTLLQDKLFVRKDVKIEFVVQKVGADPLDRHPGHNAVTSVKISFNGMPSENLFR